jgi:phosphate transport system protein
VQAPIDPTSKRDTGIERPVTETRRTFAEQLDELRDDLVKLASRVVEQIGAATRAILDGDLALVDRVYEEHAALKRGNAELEHRVYEIFALQQPIAHDLRGILATMRILHEIELSAGLMKNVARAARRLYPRELAPRIRGIIERMGEQATTQLRVAMGAYADADASVAGALQDMDDVMDDLQKDLFRAIFAEGASDERTLQQAVQVAFVGRDYERTADHAVTIGRWVEFVVTGQLPGHPNEDAP